VILFLSALEAVLKGEAFTSRPGIIEPATAIYASV